MSYNRSKSLAFIIGFSILYAFGVFAIIMGFVSGTIPMAIAGFIMCGVRGGRVFFSAAKANAENADYDYVVTKSGSVYEVNKFAQFMKALFLLILGIVIGTIATPIMIIIEIVRLKRYDHRVKRAQSPSEEQRSQALLTPKEDISSLLEKAKAGDAESQTELGERYLQGEGGVPQNGELGIQWVNAAVAQGYIPAYATLGVAYSRGKGVAQDYEKAVECFRTAAAANDAYGQQWLGSAYLLGQGVEEDHDKAFHYLRLAAAQGNQDAIDTLKEADRAFNPPSAPTQSPTQPAQVPQDDPKTGGACPGLWLAIAGTIVGFFCLYCAYSRRICWNMPMGAKICPVKISG